MDGHLTPTIIQQIANGDIPPEDALRLLLHHLAGTCPECRRVLETVSESLGLESVPSFRTLAGSELLRVLEKERARLENEARKVANRLQAAGDKAPELVREGQREAYANPVLAEILLAEAWALSKARKPGGFPLGLAAVEVGQLLAKSPRYSELGFDLRLAGLTVAANAARIEDKFELAFELLEEAQGLVEDVADPGLLCDFLRILGTTHLNTRNLDKAVDCLQGSLQFAIDAGDKVRFIKVQVLLADVVNLQGDPRRALSILRQAENGLTTLPESSDTEHLKVVIQANLTVYLIELGTSEDATSEFERLDLAALSRIGQGARYFWLKGRMQSQRGEFQEGLTSLQKAHRLFVADGYLVEASLILPEIANVGRHLKKSDVVNRAGHDLAHLTEILNDRLARKLLQDVIDAYLTEAA